MNENLMYWIEKLQRGESISSFCNCLDEVFKAFGGIKNFNVLIANINYYSLKNKDLVPVID